MSIRDTKKRGRPATGINSPVTVRMTDELLQRLDAWRSKQEDIPTRPEAVRRLLDRTI